MDLVGIYEGYRSDISRVAAFGRQPNVEAQRTHAAILETNPVPDMRLVRVHAAGTCTVWHATHSKRVGFGC